MTYKLLFKQKKLILHLSLSLQGTQGVYVAAYKTNEFPAFFTETSGCKVLMLNSISVQCFLELHRSLFNKQNFLI